MYTNTSLTQELTIVDDMLLIEAVERNKTCTLIPDTKAEILIPIDKAIDFKCIGSVRGISLKPGKAFFFMPRRRGAEISLEAQSSLFIIKLNTLFAKKIASNLEEVSNGIFSVDLNPNQINTLYKAYDSNSIYSASEVIEEVNDGPCDLFDYNMTILESIEHIKESQGTISIKEIYSLLNISKSKLEQHFNREVGLTPKEFCKIEKLNCFINSYKSDTTQSLTELTYQCGYYDQSHLIKDFKYFLDTSPKKFFLSEAV